MDKQVILSLCIPTNGVVNWVIPVIKSIYNQGYDNDKFEVVITDNGKDSKLLEELKTFDYPNIRYKKTTDEGFLNLVSCLKEGRGLFCKMINHRSILLPGSIANLIEIIKQNQDSKPIIYCSDGKITTDKEILECKNLDSFLQNLHYWSSWSAGIGFWKTDIEQIDQIVLNNMFPNASLLFELNQRKEYLIWNKKYEMMSDDAGKGGYDLFKTFGVELLDIYKNLYERQRITDKTYSLLKRRVFGFLCNLYLQEVCLPTKHTFIVEEIRKSINVYYTNIHYLYMITRAKALTFIMYIKKMSEYFSVKIRLFELY